MSSDPQEAFATLRRKVRATATQFRDARDNSESLFYPDFGHQYAYNIAAVDAALDEFSRVLEIKRDAEAPPKVQREKRRVIKLAPPPCLLLPAPAQT